jgi:hypothetical protein
MNLTQAGIDLTKLVFQVHGVDARQGDVAQAIEAFASGCVFRSGHKGTRRVP